MTLTGIPELFCLTTTLNYSAASTKIGRYDNGIITAEFWPNIPQMADNKTLNRSGEAYRFVKSKFSVAARLTRSLSDFDMTNPYSPPPIPASALNAKSTESQPVWAVRVGIVFCALTTVGFLLAAFVLIPQAIRLSNDATQFPRQFQNSNDVAIRASWVLGIACILLAFINIAGATIAYRRRIYVAWSIIGASVASFTGLAIIFRPA